MNNADKEHLNLLEKILRYGTVKGDRTGTGTVSLFGPQIEFDLQEGFPLLTTKKLGFKTIIKELLWFINGDTNLKTLLDQNVNIWTDDAYRWYKTNGGTLSKEEFVEAAKREGFDMGPIYGSQWVGWQPAELEYDDPYDYDDDDFNLFPDAYLTHNRINQLDEVINAVKYDPNSRRMVVTAWNPGELKDMALPPCHILFQLYVANGYLSLKMYQRSVDTFLGLPFNIASYAALVHVIAKMTGLEPGRLIITMGDAHIYLNHMEQVKEQLSREPKALPKLTINAKYDYISDYTLDNFELEGYDPHSAIKGKLSVGE